MARVLYQERFEEHKDETDIGPHPQLSKNKTKTKSQLVDLALLKESFARDGFVVLPGLFKEDAQALSDECDRLVAKPDEDDFSDVWKYYEKDGKTLNRIEHLLPNSALFRKVYTNLASFASESALGPVVPFKDKINFKLPGGSGFEPHQDASAKSWRAYGNTNCLTAMVAIDDSTEENGALEIVAGMHNEGLFADDEAIPPALVDSWNWKMLNMKPGDVVIFDAYTPHRSAPNTSNMSRRALFLTWSPKAEGEWYEKYHVDKYKSFPPDVARDPKKTYAYKI